MPHDRPKNVEGREDRFAHADRGSGHSPWLMVACCGAVLLAIGVLVAMGAVSGFIFLPLACVVIMGAMVFMMFR